MQERNLNIHNAAMSALVFRRMAQWRPAFLLLMFILAAGMILSACGPFRGPEERSSQQQAGTLGDSWPEVLEKGYGTLYALYVPAEGFAYVDANGRLTGVTVELVRDFADFLNERYGVNLEIDFVEETDWRAFYRQVVEGGDGLIGFGNVTITEERRKDLVFSPPYMTNIASLITHRDAPRLERLEDLERTFAGLEALAFEGTLHEERLRRLIREFGDGLEIRMAHTNDEILELTASGNHYFAYIDLYNYQRAADRGMPLQRHEAGDDPAEQFGYIMPLETSWANVVEEYFRFDVGLTTTRRYREVMETHLGKELARVLLEAGGKAEAGQPDAAGRIPGPRAAQGLPEGFGYVHEFIPRAVLDVRYAYNDNFLGVPVDGYPEHVVILTNEALKALARAEAILHEKGYGIIVFDGFRPKKAVNHFIRWARDVGDTLTKQKYYPEVDMGSGFDFFGPASSHGSPLITAKQQRNREVLRQAMLDHGFVPYHKEWWHYRLANEPFPDTYFDFDVYLR